MPFDDEMFKVYPGKVHPFEMKRQQRVSLVLPERDGAPWTDEELRTLLFAQTPTTNDELATLFRREPGAIHAVKTFMRKAILKPDQFQKNGKIDPRYGIVRRIYKLVDECNIRDWPQERQQAIAALLPGTRTRHRRKAGQLADNQY